MTRHTRARHPEATVLLSHRAHMLFSARNPQEFVEIREELAALPDCPIGREQWERAVSVYEQLSARGDAPQRSVKHPDLLIAAAAEAAG